MFPQVTWMFGHSNCSKKSKMEKKVSKDTTSNENIPSVQSSLRNSFKRSTSSGQTRTLQSDNTERGETLKKTVAANKKREGRSKSLDNLKRRPSLTDERPASNADNRSKSVDALTSKGKRTKSADSLNNMIENYRICCSLVELTAVPPTPPDGLILDMNNNKNCRHDSKHKAEKTKQRKLKARHSRARRYSDIHLDKNNANYLEFQNKLDVVENINKHQDPKMLARATRALQEHVKDVTEKTRTNCCVGKPPEKTNVIVNPDPGEPLNYIVDRNSGTTYIRGKLLGKGGFAKCYEMIDVKTHKKYAGKIICKNRLNKPHQREKILREIELHKNLRNKHVVGFHSYFEADDNVYIILEYCSRKSLVHVLKKRKTLTEHEVRYYLRQLIEGCRYIKNQRIIHRDLKLGNMLLNENMQVKIADFGLATRVEYEGEKKMTVCGTPNYIAPEVLQKKGHSYEADIWAVGCIMYAMLCGRPPFETTTLKETYMRITSNKYFIPSHISSCARAFIQKLLHPDPSQRPTLDKVLFDEFFVGGYIPKNLSPSCCDSPPKISSGHSSQRPRSYAAPVSPSEAMHKITSHLKSSKRYSSQILTKTSEVENAEEARPTEKNGLQQENNNKLTTKSPGPPPPPKPQVTESRALPVGSAIRLYQMLKMCLEQMPEDSQPSPVTNVKPLWVTKWVDYSNKYGFGFQLSDKSVGVLFNDTTRMLLCTDGRTVQYNDLSNKVYTFTTEATPPEYQKKATLLLYFAQYMDEHLIHGGNILNQLQGKSLPTSIFMKKWFRTSKAIVMYLNNGTLQVNFFEDHTKVILSPDLQDYLVTFINTKRQAVSYKLLQFRHFGCNEDIASRLSYARQMLHNIINIEGEAV